MKPEAKNVFIIDDEFPITEDFRKKGKYNSGINAEDLFDLAVNTEWQYLFDLQQLIKDIVSSQTSKEGLINLIGFSTPTQALSAIQDGVLPRIIVYDWEYPNAPAYSNNSADWLFEMLEKTPAFIFVYTKIRDELPKFLNAEKFIKYFSRIQLFLKGWKRQASFSSEEFILQYIIGAASDSGSIKIDGIDIQFTVNNYLRSASDILYLQRILGEQYLLEQMPKINFSIDTASVEKILNDSKGYLWINTEKRILLSLENESLIGQLAPLEKINYLDVIKQLSLAQLEQVLERGILKY